MFASRNFLACIELQLKERGFGAQRKAEIVDRFNGLTETFERQGYGSQIAQSMAMSRVFDDLALATRERAKRAAKVIEVQAANDATIALGKDVPASYVAMDGGTGRGGGVARAAIALIQSDPRFPTISVEQIRDSYRTKYWAMLADHLDKVGKGAFGTQRGTMHLQNIVHEIMGRDTGDANAKAFAQSYMKLDDVMVIDRNNAGGSLRKLESYFLPQQQNAAKVAKAPWEQWRDDHMKWLNWDKMTWPDGGPIPVADRERILKVIYQTLRTDGASRIDPTAFKGRGAAIGNALNDHRFMHFNGPEAWIAMHEKYGDGNVFDVISRHVENMAHRTSLIQKFGPNPDMALQNIKALVLKNAADIANNPKSASDMKAVAQAEKIIKNRLEPMFDVYTRKNALDPNSPLAGGIVATANMLTAAKLGSVPFLAAPGDFAQTLAVRMANHMPMLSGMDEYAKGISFDYKTAQTRASNAGFVFDNVVGATFTTERFSPVATHGPQITRRISDSIIRASGLNRHTEIARWTTQQEFMSMLWHDVGTAYDKLPYRRVMERYGIGEAEWDVVRKAMNTPWSPEPGTAFFRPLDILDMNIANKDAMYQRFFTMVNQESRYMVPGATLEAQVTLSGTTRPDTLPGALLHSFKMYKNFPITFVQTYGRLMLAQEGAGSRVGFAAAILGGATLVGAIGVQLRELARGKTPLEMFDKNGVPSPKFWGKAFLAGGGASVYGDFLFSGVNEYGRGAAEALAGPLAGLMTDSANLVLGDPFKYVSLWDQEREAEFKSTIAQRGAQFLRNNTPGTSLWQARLVLERELWDRLDELADPNIQRKRAARERKMKREYGNEYYLPPGQRIFGGR